MSDTPHPAHSMFGRGQSIIAAVAEKLEGRGMHRDVARTYAEKLRARTFVSLDGGAVRIAMPHGVGYYPPDATDLVGAIAGELYVGAPRAEQQGQLPDGTPGAARTSDDDLRAEIDAKRASGNYGI